MSPTRPSQIHLDTLIVVPPEASALAPNIYAIPHSIYTDKQYLLPPNAAGVVRQMIKYGTALGYLPSAGVGIGSMCYLVNLSSLKVPPAPSGSGK